MGHCKKSKHYRKDLADRAELPDVKVRAKIEHVQNGQVCLKDIELLDHYCYFGDKIDFKGHVWVPAKPFENVIKREREESVVDFVGAIYKYKNKKGETNYGLRHIENVRTMTEVAAELILVGAGLQPTKEAVAALIKATGSSQYQERYDNIVANLSKPAKALFVMIYRHDQFRLAHDRVNYFFPATYKTMMEMLTGCAHNDCDNEAYRSLVELYKIECTFSFFSDEALKILAEMLGDTPECAKKFIVVANEINSVLDPFEDQPMFISHAALPTLFSDKQDVNAEIAKIEVCKKCARKNECNGECLIPETKELLTNHVTERLGIIGGSMRSLGERAENMGQVSCVYTTGMYLEFRGVIQQVGDGKMSFSKLYSFNRMPNLPEHDEIIDKWHEIFFHDGCARNISSDGYWEIIESSKMLSSFNEWGEDDLYDWFKQKIPDLKAGDVVRFRWNWDDMMLTVANAVSQHCRTTGHDLSEEEAESFFDKVIRENFEVDEGGHLINKIYNVKRIPDIIF